MKPNIIEKDIKIRAYFLWENQSGIDYKNPISNWIQAEKEELNEWRSTPDRPKFPYIVIDQNYLRDQRMISHVLKSIKDTDLFVLLPDVAIMEMLKVPQWECTMKKSLSLLAEEPQKIKVALGFGEIMRKEKKDQSPIDEIEDKLVTPRWQALLSEIKNGDGPEIVSARKNIFGAQNLAQSQFLNHTWNKDVFVNLYNAWRQTLSRKDINDIRNDSTNEQAIELISSLSMTKTVELGLENAGYERECAQVLAGTQSISSFWITTLATSALDWLVKNGLENADPEKITNDYIDIDYIVLGIVSMGLFSGETKVNELYNLMQIIADRKWKWLQDLYKRYKSA